MEDKPLISVIIPVYWSGSVLRKTLKALYNVDYPKEKIEIIFSYYPSGDNTLDIIEEFKSKYFNEYYDIKILICDRRGVSYARNIAIKESNGKYVFILDDDVAIHKDTFKRALGILEKNPKIGVVFFPYINENPSIIERAHLLKFRGRIRKSKTFGGCAMIRREVFDKVGLYNEQLGYPYGIHEDLEISARINKFYDIVVDGTIIQTHLPKKRYDSLSNEMQIADSLLRRLWYYMKSYFTSGADSYELVLASAPLAWKVELVIYFLVPLLFIGLIILNFLWGLVYLIIMLSIVLIYYRVKNINDAFLAVVLVVGRMARSYGYFFRKLLKLLGKLKRNR